jgi:dTMP kinase
MGKFIAIEGSDGTGKRTQSDLLVEYIKTTLKKPVLKLSFPRYDHISSRYISRYLNGEYGKDVHPDLASFLYAFDRWQSKDHIKKFTKAHPGGYIISDRYTGSNLAHQGGKIASAKKRQSFYEDILDLEYNQFKILRPDINFVMTLPEKIAQQNVDKKEARSYTDKKRDLHEADAKHLANANQSFKELCQLFPAEFVEIDCFDEQTNQMKSINEIHQSIINRL